MDPLFLPICAQLSEARSSTGTTLQCSASTSAQARCPAAPCGEGHTSAQRVSSCIPAVPSPSAGPLSSRRSASRWRSSTVCSSAGRTCARCAMSLWSLSSPECPGDTDCQKSKGLLNAFMQNSKRKSKCACQSQWTTYGRKVLSYVPDHRYFHWTSMRNELECRQGPTSV